MAIVYKEPVLHTIAFALLLQTQSPENLVKTYLNERLSTTAFVSCNAAIAWPDGRTITVSIGHTDESKTRLLSRTDRMLSGSIGKTYYAAEFLRTWKQRGWSLDDPISKWIGREAWFQWLPSGDILTPRMLLNHSACLPEYFELERVAQDLENDPLRPRTIQDRLKPLQGQKSKGQPGKDWSYADTHYIVLGGIYEKATGKRFTDEVMKHFVKPLKLVGTVPSDKIKIDRLVAGYSKPNPPFTMKGSMVVDGKLRVNPQFEWTGGGFANTAESLAFWAAYLHSGKALSAELTKEMQTGVPCTLGRDQKYGLGCQIRPSKFGTSYGHSGWFPGYHSDSAYFPDKGFAVAIQFNTDDGSKLKGGTFGYLLGIAERLQTTVVGMRNR